MFEQKLKMQNPNMGNFSYDIQQLYAYIDGLRDMAALIFDDRIGGYTPRNKEWIKQRVYKHLKKLANPNPMQQ